MGQKKKANKKPKPQAGEGSNKGPAMFAETSGSNDKKLREDAEKEAQQAMQVAFIKLMNETEISYPIEDSDQSSVTGDDAVKLKWKWASGLDWNPSNMLLSSWMRCLASGDYDSMISEIEKTPTDKVGDLIERRETLYNFSALFHVIKGASTTLDETGTGFNPKCKFIDRTKQPKYLQCAMKLIELGANVNAKDLLGATPLFFCVMRYRNRVTMKIAKILLDNGANPNSVNRLGETALLQPAMMKRYDCVKFLIEHGTDPTIRDHEGGSVQDLAVIDKELRKILTDPVEAKTLSQENECCVLCGQRSKSRCTACFMTRYCSKECQLAHWEQHKKPCKATKKKFVQLLLDDIDNDKLPKDNFVGKLQLLSQERITLEHQANGTVGNCLQTNPQFKQIQEKMAGNDKGYFQIVVDKDLNVKINLNDMIDTDW